MLLTQNRVSRTHKGRYPVGPSWASSASISVLNAPKKTSDHTKRSSRDLEGRVLSELFAASGAGPFAGSGVYVYRST